MHKDSFDTQLLSDVTLFNKTVECGSCGAEFIYGEVSPWDGFFFTLNSPVESADSRDFETKTIKSKVEKANPIGVRIHKCRCGEILAVTLTSYREGHEDTLNSSWTFAIIQSLTSTKTNYSRSWPSRAPARKRV